VGTATTNGYRYYKWVAAGFSLRRKSNGLRKAQKGHHLGFSQK